MKNEIFSIYDFNTFAVWLSCLMFFVGAGLTTLFYQTREQAIINRYKNNYKNGKLINSTK